MQTWCRLATMSPSLPLRVASIISAVNAAGHTLGGQSAWSPQGENTVLQAMRTTRFDVLGVSRTYLDFYLGFGFILSVFLVVQAVLLWQLSTVAKTDPQRVKGMVAVLGLGTLGCSIVSWKFLFAIPTVFSAVLTLCLGLALFLAREA